ncbi:DUF3800 domain-containing protein [Bifidobacterium sp. UTBIF-78]|uniref:DUF3800 domain-containing protein n=1 Tax=Bifidobacterium sp. UTBIF-78 TaxID=1465263 RepID=UPI0015E32BD3|nr:DUF3800 domain-containing protein [Bifidobacterium sp. UTBIF-78]
MKYATSDRNCSRPSDESQSFRVADGIDWVIENHVVNVLRLLEFERFEWSGMLWNRVCGHAFGHDSDTTHRDTPRITGMPRFRSMNFLIRFRRLLAAAGPSRLLPSRRATLHVAMRLVQLRMLCPARARLQVAGGIPPAFLDSSSRQGIRLSELSVFVDESGEWGKLSEYYLITLVFHVQSEPIAVHIEKYERHLADSGLPDIPFHAGPLFNGHDDYENVPFSNRKRLFFAFFTLARNLPFRYVTFAHRKSMFDGSRTRFEAQLKRDLANFFLSHLDEFQSYETIKVYYDNGQQIVTNALKASIGYALSKEAVVYRDAQPKDYRLEQAADLMCTVELAALKFDAGEDTATDRKMFKNRRDFRKNYLKILRRKQF